MIVGIDEVGRGSLAGPLCIAAVALGDVELPGLTDSKKLSKKRREVFSLEIKRHAPHVGIGWVSAKDIDTIGMSQALKLAALRAFDQLDHSDVTQIIIDGTIMLLDDPRAVTMKQADLLVPSVSAASVIAKVARDQYMYQASSLFEGYGFAKHVGYGTAEHMKAIQAHGATGLHRMSFAPLTSLPTQQPKPTTLTAGAIAEDSMAKLLRNKGFTILERNWKTKWCEIDIIASKESTVHFIEVKYRKSARHGDGVAAITPRKLQQMTFAARMWLAHKPPQNAVLSVASLSGDAFTLDAFIDINV